MTSIENGSEEVEIGVGTLFRTRESGKVTKRVVVVTDPGKEGYFYVATLFETEDGSPYFQWGGTSSPESFGELVGNMSTEEVIEAARRGAEQAGYEIGQEQLDYLQEAIQAGARTIKLKR